MSNKDEKRNHGFLWSLRVRLSPLNPVIYKKEGRRKWESYERERIE